MIKEKLRAQILGGSLRDFKDHLSGIYKGYYMTVIATVANGQYIVTINAHSANDAGNAQLAAFLQNQKEVNKKLFDVKVYTYCAVLTVKGPNLLKNLPATLNETIDPVINYLLNGVYVSGCNRCGNTAENINCYEINGGYHYICDSCAGEVEVNLQERQEAIIAQKSNLLPGLVGAVLGALLGCVVWILIYKLGYIAGIAGLAIGVCSMKGYELLGKHLDKKGVIVSVIVMLVMIFFANKISWAWEVYDAFREYDITFSEAYRATMEVIKESDLMGSYLGDLGIGYLLTLLATYKNIISAFRSSMGSYSVKKEK